MRSLKPTAMVVFALLLPPGALPAQDQKGRDGDRDKIRVACLGDSITYGAGIKDRPENSYPAQLGRLLGPKYVVRNFGVNGATLLRRGDKPYVKQRAYQAAKAFDPNIVVIMLGTNDTKPQNWKHAGEFVADYKRLVKELSSLPARPKIWLCIPVPAYPGNFGIDDGRIKNGVRPKVEEVAKDEGLPVIDLYTALGDKSKLFPDKVHPNAAGAGLMARAVSKALTAKRGSSAK